jgi:ABC-type Fe3+-siderophore transport system permease subunit
MRDKYLEILKKTYFNLTNKDLESFKEIMREDGLGKCQVKFNFYAFIFGWFYLLYRKMVTESFGVLITSLMIGYILAYAKIHPILVLVVMIAINSFLSGFCYYFLYLNKLDRDVENCGGVYNVDIECVRKKAKPNIWYVVGAIIFILILIWPIIFSIITGADISK